MRPASVNFHLRARAAIIPRRPMLKFPLLIEELRDKIHAPQEAVGRQLFDDNR